MPTCQDKDGCDREAVNRVVATLGPDTYARLLCPEHTEDAVLGNGYRTMSDYVRRSYGPATMVKVYNKMVAGKSYYGTRNRKRSPYLLAEKLRAAVPHDTPIEEGDTVLVCLRGYQVRRGELASDRWGFAKVLKKGIWHPMPEGPGFYRHLTFPHRAEWEREVASVVPYPLDGHDTGEGFEDVLERQTRSGRRR